MSCNTTVVTTAIDASAAAAALELSDDSSTDDDGDSKQDSSWEGSVTRCICGFQHDDGYMICCDVCRLVVDGYQWVRYIVYVIQMYSLESKWHSSTAFHNYIGSAVIDICIEWNIVLFIKY